MQALSPRTKGTYNPRAYVMVPLRYMLGLGSNLRDTL